MNLYPIGDSLLLGLDSLFLPLLPEQNAIFCALTSLFDWTHHQQSHAVVNGPLNERKDLELTYSTMETVPCQRTIEASSKPPERSKSLFKLLSARVEVAVVVFRTSEVAFFDLRSKQKVPSIFRCIHSNGNSWSNNNSIPTSHPLSAPALGMASCAALISLELSYVCRIPCGKKEDTNSLQYCEYSYPRGVIGGEDGRVSVFSEHAYLLSFIAHDCPVVSVNAIYTYTGKDSREEEEEGGMENLGFITEGADGVVYGWWHCKSDKGRISKRRRKLLSEKSIMTDTTTMMPSRKVAFAVYQPRFDNWLLLPSYAMLFAPDVALPNLFFIHASSPDKEENINDHSQILQARPFNTTEASEGVFSSRFFALPTSSQQRIDAIAVDGELCAVAQGVELFLIQLLSPEEDGLDEDHTNTKKMPTGRHIFSSPTPIMNLFLQNDLLAGSCNEGHLFVLEVPSGRLLTSCRSYKFQPVKSITLNSRARLMAVVDDIDGAIEIIRLPTVSFKHASESLRAGILPSDVAKQLYAGSAPAARVLPTALALRYRCQIEEFSHSKSFSEAANILQWQATTNPTTIKLLDDADNESIALKKASGEFLRKVIESLKETYNILRFSIPWNHQQGLS
ncbi:unnamed protein product [Phytomonas sp. Hart1]|nr:unnamed protein product [Phytomonas sp. Hart1]|eukprot:CCW72031.1 unnamed protein product [Phytomonas sp. isolate Hart1]